MAQGLVFRLVQIMFPVTTGMQIQETREDQIRVSREVSAAKLWPIHRVVREFFLRGGDGCIQAMKREETRNMTWFAARKGLQTRT